MSNTKQVQSGFAEVNGTTLYYEVAGAGHPFVLAHGHLLDRRSWDDQFAVFAQHYRVIRYDQRGFGDSGLVTKGVPYSARQDLYELMKFLGIESAYIMGVSGGGALAIDFTLEHPEMVDALIPVTAGVSGFHPSEDMLKQYPDVVRMYTSLSEAFEKNDIARAVEISLELWTDGPGRLPGQADSDVRERVREMTTRNWNRPDGEAQAETPTIPDADNTIRATSSGPSVADWGANARHSRRVRRAKPAGSTGSRDPGSQKGNHGRNSASSFYGETSRVQPDRTGFSGIAQVVTNKYKTILYVIGREEPPVMCGSLP
jgi:3-oxoadipate enol-lactonase